MGMAMIGYWPRQRRPLRREAAELRAIRSPLLEDVNLHGCPRYSGQHHRLARTCPWVRFSEW